MSYLGHNSGFGWNGSGRSDAFDTYMDEKLSSDSSCDSYSDSDWDLDDISFESDDFRETDWNLNPF